MIAKDPDMMVDTKYSLSIIAQLHFEQFY